MNVNITKDSVEFAAHAAGFLAAEPVLTTVLGSNLEGALAEKAALQQDWWAWVCDGTRVVGAAMRTAPTAARPPYLSPMPVAAAAALAEAVIELGEDVTEARGFHAPARAFLQVFADRAGDRVEIDVVERLYELTELIDPPAAPGTLRPATHADLDLITDWIAQFWPEADVQAGRDPRPEAYGPPNPERWSRRIDAGGLWLWDDGGPVCLVGRSPASGGVARIGPVYTPAAARGRGYAGAAVAEVSRRILGDGLRLLLFADRDNATSSALYERLGFEAVAETVDVRRV